MANKNSVLGRGLDALLDTSTLNTKGSSSINEIEISKISPNPNQPRKEFDQIALEELATSIQSYGIIQPITLNKVSEDNYQIVAGERRFRASQLAGLQRIPAYIRTIDDETIMEMALIENIQREDLNAIEIALAYRKLIDQNKFTQEQLSERLGKNRATITNYLRLLKLPAVIQIGLKNNLINMGHARSLISVTDPKKQLMIYETCVKEGLSVRDVEQLVRKLNKPTKPQSLKNNQSEHFEILSQHLSTFFKSKIKLKANNKGKGSITIPFSSEDDLERIISIFDAIKS